MSGENHEGNKSPDIYDGINQRGFLCSRAMKHEALKAYETQGSSLEGSKEGKTPECPRADNAVTVSNIRKGEGHECQRVDKAVVGSNVQKRKEHRNVQGWIRLLLRAMFNKGKDTKMSIGRKGCCWEQRSIEERTPKCPLADRDVVGSNIRRGEGT
jgi:hypothetical protein